MLFKLKGRGEVSEEQREMLQTRGSSKCKGPEMGRHMKDVRIERSQIWLVCREQRDNGMVWPERGRGQGYGTDYTKDIK